ncbi:hypothetical protein GGD52_003313 [Agrobacterium tumefaciens]|nr:hypothetical protein [Agrobacterium radiobacter]MBB5588709.1 hypothetical protein [Agrobacterium radiobacter]
MAGNPTHPMSASFSAASHSVALLGELNQERQRLEFLFIVPAHARVGWPLPDGHRGGRSLARIRAPECGLCRLALSSFTLATNFISLLRPARLATLMPQQIFHYRFSSLRNVDVITASSYVCLKSENGLKQNIFFESNTCRTACVRVYIVEKKWLFVAAGWRSGVQANSQGPLLVMQKKTALISRR